MFGEDLLVCRDAAMAGIGPPRAAKPLVAGIRALATVPYKDGVPILLQLYRYNTAIRAKVATQEWAQAFPEQTFPNYSEVASASGCNQDVCIYVKGEGRTVEEWWTSAWQHYGDGRICPDAYWTVDYDPTVAYPYHWDVYPNYGGPCATVAEPDDRILWYGYTGRVPAVFEDRSILCNRWRETADPLEGFPCIRIKT